MADQTALASRPRITGVTIPLFSLRTDRSWGIGEINDLAEFAVWVNTAGVKLVQILPLGEIAGNETSPYSALSAFGIDPLFISLADVPDLPESELRAAVGGDVGMALLEQVRGAERIDYANVRLIKGRALRHAYEHFKKHELAARTSRAEVFEAFASHERGWLDDYALFRALKDANGGVAWWDWSDALKNREPGALQQARNAHADAVQFFKYAQWLAHEQWHDVRSKLAAIGVEVMGDLPFMVGRDSADVWSNQREFRLDMNVGVPPDQFDQDGQDWGLPPYNWLAMRQNDFAWLRRRARYSGSLYNRFRIDHLVGFYRTYMRPLKSRDEQGKLVTGAFDPADERAQIAHGERVISAMSEAAAEKSSRLVAEDLGIVPDAVRASLAELEVPGYKVLIWEKDGAVFRDPLKYPAVSVACFGTHDTDPVPTWWETRDEAERTAVKQIPAWKERAQNFGAKFTPEIHRAILDLIQSAPSQLVLLLIQDVFAIRARINTPGTQGPQNWSWRLPAPVRVMRDDGGVKAALATVKASIDATGR
jgi:4-alpha-glucanotransferase